MRSLKIVIPIILCLLLVLFFSGCVSKSSYDKAQSDLAAAQQSLSAAIAERDIIKAQLTQLQSDMTTAQSELDKAESELATSQQSLITSTNDRNAVEAQLSKAQSDLKAIQDSLATLDNSVKKSQPYVDIASGYIKLALAGINGSTTDALSAYSQISVGLSSANDLALQVAWDKAMADPTSIELQMPFLKLLIQKLNETKPKTN